MLKNGKYTQRELRDLFDRSVAEINDFLLENRQRPHALKSNLWDSFRRAVAQNDCVKVLQHYNAKYIQSYREGFFRFEYKGTVYDYTLLNKKWKSVSGHTWRTSSGLDQVFRSWLTKRTMLNRDKTG